MRLLQVCASVAAVVVVGGGVAVLGQQRPASTGPTASMRGAEPKGAEPALFPTPARQVVATYDPALSVVVNPTLQLDAPTAQLYQQMATALDGSVLVPDGRTAYYAAVNGQGNYSITGWGAQVQSVQADGHGGYNVTITVNPGVDDSTYSLNSLVFDVNYTETYNVANGGYSYIGSADPEGRAGQLPLIVRI